jgi:phage tail-like protein
MPYAHKWNYNIEKDGVVIAKMRTCSEVNWDAQDINVDEGGNPLTHKEPGKIEVTDVTLERGVGVDEDFHTEAQKTIDFGKLGGLTVENLKSDYDIVDLDRDGTELRRVTLFNSYVKQYSFGDWDASANEVTIEKIVLRYDFPQKASIA